MDNKWTKRLVSLTVALEMFCSPLATARAEEVVTERPEIPAVVSEERVERPAISSDGGASAADADGSAALLTLPVDENSLGVDLSFGIPLTTGVGGTPYPTRYDGYFTYESGSNRDWGYRVFSLGSEKYFVKSGDNFYTVLTDPGRLPDLELDGYYVLGEPTASSWLLEEGARANMVKGWTYDESWGSAAIRVKETNDDVGFTGDDDVDYAESNYLSLGYLTGEEMDGLFRDNIARNDFAMGFVPMVARWKASANTDLTRLRATTYTQGTGAANAVERFFVEDPTGLASPADVELSAIDADYFASHGKEFWLRVGEDQESLTLQFEAFEPYYDYNVTKNGEGECPVSVSVLFNGAAVTVDGEDIQVQRGWSEDSSDAVVPQPTETGGWLTPRNTAGNPARSHWSVSGIPLAKVDQAEDMNDASTTITITVLAPDGQSSSRYTIHVERLMTPDYELGLGNTPPAMIEKDQHGNWGNTAAEIRANKDAAKADFKTYYRLGNSGIVGPGDYTYYKSWFDPSAWRGLVWEGSEAGYNIDLDETAVVAYQDTAFADPGVSFVGSNGKKVVFGANADGDYQTCVTRTIELRQADVLTADCYGTAGQACWYTNEGGKGVLKTTPTAQVLQNGDGSDGVDLRGMRVLPGVYTMTYTFVDPLDPVGGPVVAKRPLVVIPIPGDVDMDGAVTVADALTLDSHQADWDTSAASDLQLLRHRVLGTKDAADIVNGFQPVLADLGRSDYFYPPMPTPSDAADTYQRKTWDQVTMDGSAHLELRFLGVEQGILDGENSHTNPATDGHVDLEHGKIGPWLADENAEVTVREKDAITGQDKYGVAGQNDVFWVGVYLTAGELAGNTVEDLTFTLTYDSDFVEPMTVYYAGQFDDASQRDRWYRALYYYNFGEGSKLDQSHTMTLFSGYNRTDYDYESGSAPSRAYATHYSKVIGELEQLQRASSLREMVVSIQGNDAIGSRRATLPSGETCVLAVPFRLLKHPTGGRLTDGQARLVELGAGMRDLTLVTKAASGASRGVSASSVFATLLSAADGRAMEPGDVTYAFSAQDTIYGGATQNLREQVSYRDADGAIPGMIPIGENKTSAIELHRAKYAEDYGRETIRGGGTLTAGHLPEGLEYHNQPSGEGIITGTPTEAGEFHFTITHNGVESYYILVVEKRALHFRANGCGSYYGQDKYRGESHPEFTFTYEVDDLALWDRSEDVELKGDGAELVSILGGDGSYTPPTFTAKLSRDTADAGNPVKANTPVGTYPIILDEGTALDDKYELVLDETLSIGSVLNIDRRPVWIDHITATVDQTGAQIYSDGSQLDCRITLTETDPDQPMIHLTLRAESLVDGIFGGRPLSGEARVPGDTLKLSFSGEFQRNDDDIAHYPDNNDMFYMAAEMEERVIRPIAVDVRKFNEDNRNYVLQSVSGTVTLHEEDNHVQGKVLRREITELEFSDYPYALNGEGSVTYGENISLSDLRVRVFRDDQQIGSQPYDFTYDYDGSMAQALDIHYNWVTKEEMEAGLKSPNTVVGSGWDPTLPKDQQDANPYRETNQSLSVDLDGMYLCAIARKYAVNDPNAPQGDNAFIKVYSDHPIHVLPREVTLSVTDMNRFYGEEGAQPRYTYSVNQLASSDLQKLRGEEYYGKDYTFTGASEELERLLEEDPKFQKPTIQFMRTPRLPTSENDEDLIGVDTDATNTYYYQVISGAKSSNYIFRYNRVDGDRRPSTDFGTAYLSIMKRPIVVADVSSMYTTDALGHAVPATAAGGQDTFAVLYADSKRLLLGDQVDNGAHTAFIASADPSAINRVTFTAPDYDEATQTVSYYNGGASDNVARQTGMAYTGDPVRAEDLESLRITYKVQFLPDQGRYSWYSFSDNYYSVEDLTAMGGQAQRPVELRELELTSEDGTANNYMLVYKDSFQAVRRAPANSQLVNAPNPTGTADTGDAAFQQYGTGLVILRPIKTMDIKAVGCMEYTYGEFFAPNNPGVSGNQFTLSVNYDTRYDNYTEPYVGNVSSENVVYTYEADTSSFEKRGFVIHYIDVDAQDKNDVAETGQILMGGDALYPAVHNGKHLFVSGKRGENDPLVYSSVTDSALSIDRTPLTLTARNIHRFYGENNAEGYVIPLGEESEEAARDGSLTFTYVFPAAQLARWDREMLSQLLDQNIREVDTITQGQLERALELAAVGTEEQREWCANFGYQKPTITTSATQTSPVNTSHGRWGEYDINNTAKPFANYLVTGVGATLFIYPRPIRVTGIASSEDDPVYTIYNQTAGKIFHTAFDQSRVTVARSNGDLTTTWTQDLADGVHRGVALKLSGPALVGEDQLRYKAVIDYNSANTTLPDGRTEAYMEVVATVTEFSASEGEAERNYALSTSRNGAYTDSQAIGAVKLRTIGYIIIRQLPEAKYDYGQTLSLDGLRVAVNYMLLGDEGVAKYEQVNVDYIDANQFQSYGLFVNYWDPTYDVVPAESRWKSIPNAYRKAANGDHLTIAPTHDTQQFLGNDKSKPLERPFAANGMGLIISAFQEGENQTAAQPKVLAAQSTPIEGTGLNSFEVTDVNQTPFTFTVRPRRLQYTLSATDKTYNGDVKTAGTIRLTNLFDQKNVQTQITSANTGAIHTEVYEDVTDVVYVPVGASYETRGDNYQSYAGSAYRVMGGGVSFTTGAYTDGRGSLLEPNPSVEWSGGYQWGKGLLEFTFPNANVHYVDDTFQAGAVPGVGTAELAQYWRASQDLNGVDSRWDSYPDVSQMPVEVRNMTFAGPDAANYTWGPSTEPQTFETQLTLDTDPATLGADQASLPYATVQKANRQSIQELLSAKGFVLPTLQVDDRTNVIRMTYGQDLSKIDDLTGAETGEGVLNADGKDDFRDELHFEYALAYEADGLLRQWAGREGDAGYQDTLFFGGEAVAPENAPGYIPDLEQLDRIEDADESTVYKGQRYRWAQEDTGLSERGYREDSGFVVDAEAYPGYATYGPEVLDAYWNYALYATDRAALPRDTVFYPLVRLAETHNYNPSGDLTADSDGDGHPDVSAQALYEARQAVGAYVQNGDQDQAQSLLSEAQAKSGAVLSAYQGMEDQAQRQAADRVAQAAAWAEDGLPETEPSQPEAIAAVKSYRQRFDVLSASWEDQNEASYLVKILEDVRFTDTLVYPEQTVMDSVVFNNPTRYYGYYWDPDLSGAIQFSDEDSPVDFDTVMEAEIQPSQLTESVIFTYDPAATGHTAQIYVNLSSGGRTVRSIRIVPSMLLVRLGDAPVQLTVVTEPRVPTNRYYTWTSSDPSVVTVDQMGLVVIRGEGKAVITVTTTNGRRDSISVVVAPLSALDVEKPPIFDRGFTGAWATLDENYAFRPYETMTRGEMVQLLDLFLNPEYDLTGGKEIAYVDVTGREKYYGALCRLTKVGAVVGVPGTAFAGERLATRAEFVTILARMLELNVPDTVGMAHAFADSGEDATWAYAYIDAMAKAGVIRGTGEDCFAPSRPITREEAAAIMARLVVSRMESDDQTGLRVPSDMTPENWSYPSVLRAVNSVVAPGF